MDNSEPRKAFFELSKHNNSENPSSSLPGHGVPEKNESSVQQKRKDVEAEGSPVSSKNVGWTLCMDKTASAKLLMPDGKERASTETVLQVMSSSKPDKRKWFLISENVTNGQEDWQASTDRGRISKRSKAISDENPSLTEKRGPSDTCLYGLTISIWRQIFGYLPPATLACLLRVSRSFNWLLLTQPRDLVTTGVIVSPTVTPESEAIWRNCHKLFASGVPFPAQGQTELSMWKLIKGNRCQHCGRKKPLQTATQAPDVWSSGPGADYVRILWPFLVRLCGQCLHDQCQKEKELLLSNTMPLFLIEELPFMFVLESDNCVSELTLRDNVVPLGLRLSKIFYKPQIALLKQAYHHLAHNSPGLLDSWTRSLASLRATRAHDSERWEAWERKGILNKVNKAKTRLVFNRSSLPPSKDANRGLSAAKTNHSLCAPTPSRGEQLYPEPQKWNCYGSMGNQSSDLSMSFNKPPGSQSYLKHVGIPIGMSAIQGARRSEIIKRCSYMEPPIGLELLDQMKSFRASLQIEKEMDDQQWGVLKERLSAEKPEAMLFLQSLQCGTIQLQSSDGDEAADFNKSERNAIKQASSGSPTLKLSVFGRLAATSGRHTIPFVDRAQKKLAALAREIIRNDWNDGNSLSKDACSQFAAEVLIQTREAYLAEIVNVAGTSTASPSLTMEHMKWLFETFIKPLTDQHQKEIFLCRSCENSTKPYGFEGVVQHYAAKHTNLLSLGNAVVHWKAEWPHEPPFHPNPMNVKAHAIIASTSNGPQIQPLNPDDLLNHKFSHSTRFDTYNEIHDPRLISVSSSPFTSQPAPFFKSMDILSHSVNESPSFPFTKTSETPPAMNMHGFELVECGVSIPEVHNSTHTDTIVVSPQFKNGPSVIGEHYTNIAAPTTEVFRAHQAEMAKFARELWFATAGIKGLPGPLRVQAIIHHASERFVRSFGVEPGVNMFLFGLNHEAAMRPLRSLNGFSCRACWLGQPGSLPVHERKRSQTLPHLLNHFMALHAEYHRLDWRRDMIQLPSLKTVSDLVDAPGIDDTKLALFIAAFPNAFPRPLLSLDRVQQSTLFSTKDSYADAGFNSTCPPIDHAAKNNASYNGGVPTVRAKQSINSLDDEEYDPRRPSYLGRIVDGRQGQSPDLRHSNNTVQERPLGSQSTDADRFLEELQPHLGRTNSLRPRSRSHMRTPRLYYDRIYIDDNSGKHPHVFRSDRANQLPTMRGTGQRQHEVPFDNSPEFSRFQSYREFRSEIEPASGWKTALYCRAEDDSVLNGVLHSPPSTGLGQPVTNYRNGMMGSNNSICEQIQLQDAGPQNAHHMNHLPPPESPVVHASRNIASDPSKDSLYYPHSSASRAAHFRPEPGSFLN